MWYRYWTSECEGWSGECGIGIGPRNVMGGVGNVVSVLDFQEPECEW